MRIMEKTIAVLLVICMMFSFLPVDMMSGVLEDVFADVPSDSNYTVTSKTPGEYTPGGPLSRGQPGIRVVLSRDPDTYLNGTEEALNAMYNAFSYKYPISATDNNNFLENSLFILDDNKDGGVYRKWSGWWANNGGANVKDSTISFYSLNPTVGILNYSGEDVRNLVFARRVVNTCPENKFKTTVVGLYDAKQISGTDALADNVWKLYMPTEDEAYDIVSYVFNYTTSFQQRVIDFVDEKFNIYDLDAKELTNKDKFEIATGYVGLLSSLYVVADAQGADRVAASYEKAINDYLFNNNIKAQPVTLIVDTCQVYREAGTATQSIMPSIDVLELSLASQSSYSVLDGDGAFLETLNKQGTRVTTAKTGISGFTMRQQLHEIAAASLEAYPYSTTKGYATGSNDVTQKKILRLSDMPTSRTKWYTNSQHNHPLGYCLPVVSLSSKSAGSGGQGSIWTRDNDKVHWVSWDWDKNDGHFLDIFHTGEDGFLDGWAIVGSHFSDPTPTASFFVVDTIQGTPDTCEEYVQIITPSKLTISIGQGSDFLSYLDTLPEDSKISLEASISRKEYKDSLKSTPVETIEHLTDLEDDLFLDQVSVEVFKSKITNTITLEDSYFVDSNGAPKTYQRLKNNPMLVLFEYEVDLTLTIDNTVYEFKSDDIVARVGDTPQNSSSFQIKAYKADADAAPDVEIIAPTDRTKPDYNHNPSANENLAELTQVIRWYEYTSVMGSMAGNVDASFGSSMGYDDTSVDADIGAFAEIKSNTPGDEKYEVLGGIPSTEELYFSVGGAEWKVSMILQYWMNEHSRERTYTIQFDGTTCEFNNNKKGEGDIWEGINLPSASGATQTITRFDHTGATVTATWTGEITNKATAVTKDGKATHSVTVTAECPAQVDNSAYTTAVSNANAWIKAMNDLTSSLKWKAASDEKERTVTYSLSDLGTGKASQTQGAADNGSGTYTCTSNGNNIASANYSFSYSNPKDTSKTETFTVSCNYSPPDSEGNGGSPCTNEQASGSVTAEPDSSKPFSITVTYKIEAHALCGPCCGHELPALWDTWKQGMVFDYMKISQIRLFLLDQGSVEGMTELTGTDRITASVVSGNPTYFMNIATNTEQYTDPYMVAGGLSELEGTNQGNTWYAHEQYDLGRGSTYPSLTVYNNREAQSSRAGRIRYLLDPTWAKTAKTTFDYKYGPGGTTDAVGGTKSGTITIDYNKVANPKQHDDVIYKVGTRTPNCDGMATSGNFGKDSTLNSNPTLTTGHVNKWADGMLYTNILNTEDYSGYWNDANVATIASTYEPKELRENDANLVKYREDYGHHLAEEGLVKTDYGHHADIVDTRTAEWQVFNAARTTKIIGIVISDFLIMQTSGGDQSVFYFEKASVPTEAQEHFQKVSTPEAEMTTDNPLSIFNAAAVCEDSTIKDGVANYEIVGGYNGRYDDPANKYRPYSLVTQEYLNLGGPDGNNWNVYNASYKTTDWQTRAGDPSDYNMYGNTKIVTIFDDDPAGSFNRPKRQAETTGLKIYQDNLQILPTTPNRYYQPTDASIWYVQAIGMYSAGGHFMNKQSGGYGVWTAGNVNLGWPYRERYGDSWLAYWGTSIGLQLNTKYYLTKDGDSNTSSVNGVVVYTPVSAEDALVLPQGDLTVNGITVSRDQRVESFTFPDMNEVVNALKVCTLDPATCEYRFLDCKYLHDTVVAEFDFEDTTKTTDNRYYVTNNVTGVEYLLPSGFSITSGTTFAESSGKFLNATGTNAWSIPFADLGIANDKTNRVKVSMDLKVNATSGNTMIVGFRNLGFVISSGGGGKFLVPYDEDPTIVGTSKSFTNTMKTVHLDIIFGFNNIVDCTAYVNGQEATVSQILDYRNEWTKKIENGKEVQRLEKTHVALAGEKLKLNPPDNFTTADIMASINIGTWSNTDTTYTANFYLDNLEIILMGGTTEHTSACYVTSTTHAVSKVHVCNEDCWLKEDLYTCDGLPNANYQLGCGKEEGIPKVTVNTSVDFEYKDYGQVVTLTPGTYKLEVWGAQGGGTYGGKGGYSSGNLVVTQTTDFYVYVGSMGSDYNSSASGYQTAPGGFNGGGDGYGDQGATGGGGATDIRRAGTALSNRIIVAGGGGGQATDSSTYYGGVGGGTNGTAGYSGGTYGTQSSGYAIGEGGNGSSTCSSPDNGGGGGGYYGGYGGSDDEGAGGGGSGYIGGVTSGGTTTAGNASMTQPDGTTATGHSGNGYARITVVSGGGTITTDDYDSLEYGVPTTYTYSGDYEEITLEPGLYVVELYGAKGGDNGSGDVGSNGTYVKTELTITQTTTAYLAIGGQGNVGNNTAGGWNGGGKAGGCSCGSGSGGGATDIRIGGKELSNRVIVAGGGGGAGDPGSDGKTTAKSCGTLGQGDYGHTSNDGGGGGGGYYGGYTGQTVDAGGYIGTSYVNGTEYTSDVSSGNTIVTHNSNSGNGYIVITPKGHVHSGTPGLDYANGCYTVPTVHKHDVSGQIKELICGMPEGGSGEVKNFEYKGYTQAVTLPSGKYRLEVWGAQGGGDGSSQTAGLGGKGGYSTGILNLEKSTTLYVNVGGKGLTATTANTRSGGGWNGGGTRWTHSINSPGNSGGGATDISLKGTDSTTSWNTVDHLYSRIIVAGGGGGGGEDSGQGAYGGGLSGGSIYSESWTTTSGTQTSPANYFGYGAHSGNCGGGGGGGWYGGLVQNGISTTATSSKGQETDSGGGGGGSGYVYTASTASDYPSGCLLNSSYYLTSASTIAGNTSFTAPDGGTETGHSGDGYARITNLDHQHTDACYKTTSYQTTCSKIPAGTYRCTGEPNATTNFNIHEHTVDCLYDYYELTPRTYNYVGDVITYKVPYTDDYRIEAYGASSGTRSGYTSAVVRLKRGDVLYFYIGGRDGFNNGHTDVRVLTSFYNYNQIIGIEDDIEREEWLMDYQRSLDSRILNSATVYNGSFVSDFGTYTLSQTSVSEVGNSSDGRVIITPLNKLPVTETPEDNYILEQILNGDIPEEDVYKYLGDDLADLIINTAQPFATFENFSWTNHQGVTPVSNPLSFNNGNIVNLIETGSAYEFSIPVNIAPKTLRKIVVTLDNNTASTDFGVAINQVGSANRVLASMKANTKNQEISINVRDLCWNKTVTKLIFNTSANDNTGTTVIKKIELYGHADWTETKPNSTYAYSNIAKISGFSSTNTNGFTSLANCTLTYNNGSMVVTPTGSNSRTTWNSVEKIEANALKAIKLVFTNKSGSATTGEMYYKNSASESWSETRGYQWYVGSGTAAQTVWIDLVNKITYNETTNTFRRIGGTQTAWANDIVAMRFDWTNLTTGSVEVSEITFIGKGSTSIKHTFNYLQKAQPIKLTSGKWNLDLYGAQGGDGRLENSANTVESGGLGGRTQGTITANGSTLYYVYVGGKGGAAPTGDGSFGLGGWNGGGAGGTELNSSEDGYPENGAGGGGMTHITISGTDGESVTNSTTQKTVTVAPLATPVVVKTATSGSGSVSLTPGIYRLEATGAQGTAGEGGLASGWLKVTSTGTYYYSVGGQGAYTWVNSSNSATNALVKAGSGAMKAVAAVTGGYTTHTHTADCAKGNPTYSTSGGEGYTSFTAYTVEEECSCSMCDYSDWGRTYYTDSARTNKVYEIGMYVCSCPVEDDDGNTVWYSDSWNSTDTLYVKYDYTCNNLPLNDGYITPVTGQAAQAEQTSSTYNVEQGRTIASASIQQSITITRYVDLSAYSNVSDISYTITDTNTSSTATTTFGTYTYQGKGEVVTLPAGTYTIEAWGAQGGSNSTQNSTGKLGGYVKGTYSPSSTTNLFIVVGGKGGDKNGSIDGSSSMNYNGGFNGGGSGSGSAGPGGGGATHIQIGSTGNIIKNNYNYSHSNTTGDFYGAASSMSNLLLIAYGGGAGSQTGTSTLSYMNGGNGQSGWYSDDWTHDCGGGGAGYQGGYGTSGDDTYYGYNGTSYVNTSHLSSTSTSAGTLTGNGKVVISRVRTVYTNTSSVSNVTFKVTVNETSKSMTFDTSKVIAVAGGGGGGTGYTNASHTAASETWGGNGGGTSGTSTNTTYTTPGTQNSGYDVRGVGGNGYSYLGGANYAGTGGGGAGWYGGYTSKALTQTTPIGGAGGSGYASSAVSTPTLTAGVRRGNGVAILTSNGLTGTVLLNAGPDSVTDVTITAGTYSGTPFKATYVNPLENDTARQTIEDNFKKIPDMVDDDYNPIFVCKFQEKNKHECSILDEDGEIRNLCVTTVRLDCTEPHHKGVRVDEFGNTLVDKYDNPICKEHYAGSNRICWSACGNDDNHKLTKTEVDVDDEGTTVLQLAEYLQIDEGFTVYFPNRGNFYGNGLLGLSAPQTTRGYGYYNNMDTTRWTREKRVMFPFPVIYENLTYPAYTWIELEVSEVYFNFYLPVSTAEMANARVVFEVEAINCGTKQGTNPLLHLNYSDTVDNAYTDALNTFVAEYLGKYQEDVKSTGYKIIRAKSEEDKAGVGHRLAYSEVGILKFLETKQDRVNGEVAELVKALEKIDRQVEYDFEGDRGDYINPNATVDNGINNALKPLTFNDNRYRFDNTLRSDSYQSLHGGYKKFYLDVIGRIGNFAITDTEDFRFSNFFKVSIDNIPENTTFDATDPNSWLVDGLVKQVDENIQNYYVGDLYDIRGNKASVNTRWLDTYGTQSWMAGTYENGDRNINEQNLVSQILTGDVNTIEVLQNEELRFGYDIFTSIVTMGSYQEGQVQIIPKYYALKVSDKTLDGVPAQFNVKKGEYVPLDVYVNKDGAYEPVNIFGNAANGNSNKGNVQLSDYVFNLDWTNEAGRRNFSLDEQARTNRVKEYYRTFIYDMSAWEDPEKVGDDMASDMNIEDLSIIDVVEYVTPQGETNYLGTPQYILLDGRHRTFIGDSKSYDNNLGGEAKWVGPAETTNFGLDKGIYPNAYDVDAGSPLEQIEFERSVQRWHSKIGLPSSAVFVPHGQTVNATTLDYIMGENEDEWVIVCTAEIIAVGAIWNINYSQPWFTEMKIGGNTFETHNHKSGCTCNKEDHYPGHKVTDPDTGATVTCPWCIDPIIAVFGKTSVQDVEISQIY